MWLFGQGAWSEAELARHQVLPWVEWPVAVKLCGGMMPMFALVAWPHQSLRGASPASICLDLCGLAVMSAFLCWSLIVAPGLVPAGAPVAIRSLLAVSALVHAAIVGSFVYAGRSAGPGAWRTVYNRCALGAALGVLLLTPNMWAMFEGRYATGAPGDIGWIVPFRAYAFAAAHAPASLQEAPTPLDQWQTTAQSGLLLLGTVAVAPLIGYVPRYLRALVHRKSYLALLSQEVEINDVLTNRPQVPVHLHGT